MAEFTARVRRLCAGEIDRTIQWELPETVAGVIVEPIITGGGMIVPADGYLPENLATAAVREEWFDVAYRLLELTVENDAAWHQIWQEFKAGA